MKTLFYDIEIVVTLNEDLISRLYTGFLRPGMLMSANMSHMLMMAYQWLGEKKVHYISITDYPLFKKDPTNDRELVKHAAEILNSADHLVAHYGNKFDRKFIDTRLLIHGLPLLPRPSLLKQSDTCILARQHLKLDSNKLEVVAKVLGLTPKKSKGWPTWWLGAAKGDRKSLALMKDYCLGDVVTLEEVYKRLSVLDVAAPDPNLTSDHLICRNPTCGNAKFTKRGFVYLTSGKYNQLECTKCHRRQREPKAIKLSELR